MKLLGLREEGEDIVHLTPAPLEPGCAGGGQDRLAAALFEDAGPLRRAHPLRHCAPAFRYDNVGFHMGEEAITIDFSGELSREDLSRAELEAKPRDMARRACAHAFAHARRARRDGLPQQEGADGPGAHSGDRGRGPLRLLRAARIAQRRGRALEDNRQHAPPRRHKADAALAARRPCSTTRPCTRITPPSPPRSPPSGSRQAGPLPA